MNRLLMNSLWIFELKNKLAKRVDFKKGINIVTSDQEDGNDVGKSVLLKSLYHTLGADGIFDDKWEEISKVYIVSIDVNGDEYYIHRYNKIFKIFTKDFQKLFETNNRLELSYFLKEIYGFCVRLPDRDDNRLEITPPVFSYLLNYVDQDYMSGSKFSSFKALTQYTNIKEDTIYNHFGIYNEEYFEASKLIEQLKKEEKNLSEEKKIIDSMLKRIKEYLKGMDVTSNLESLNIELEKSKQEYTEIVINLKKAKNSLITLRNEKMELEESIKDLLKLKKSKEGEVQKVNEGVCPTCSQYIDDIGLRISEHSELEDFVIMKNQLDELLLEANRKLEKKEVHYTNLLQKFDEFEKGMSINQGSISDALKHRGYIETQDSMIKEYGIVENKLSINKADIQTQKKILTKCSELKKKANALYEGYMIDSINKFGLEEISLNKVKSIKNNLTPRGSNIPISTIIWYFNLLKIKDELNSESIKFPLVLDSPNNVELDENKRKALFNYIFTNKNEDTQLILSTLGFDLKDYKEIKFSRIIKLENKKYGLLNTVDYENNRDILEKIFEA
ncbi:hypothetical protein [Bacillus sp. TE8-1]|uniref:hypothetical protein n=1 Tax=Bacillus sp. TE8-1 TaxID=2217829 RepID=UPI0011EE51D0|nr:hypothetical protein [Bacillus sp. TE8-1]KAA0761720.1 hypothetical protein DN404_25195 [Bacillus sp. TE8-1]